MLTTDQKGAIAEMAIAWEATKLGIEVYRPLSEGGRFDMISCSATTSYACNASGRHCMEMSSSCVAIHVGVRARECECAVTQLMRLMHSPRIVLSSIAASSCQSGQLAARDTSNCVWRQLETTNEMASIGLTISTSRLHWRNPEGP
jgi:hypothetical protein